jgi:hypothetical protein
MGVARNHCFVMVEHANEGSDLLNVARQCDLKDHIDHLLLQFDTFSGKYETKYLVSNVQKLDFLVLT